MIILASPEAPPTLWPDIFDLIAGIVASLAWPVAAVVLLLRFRKGVAGILDAVKERVPSMERLKTPWVEAAWSSTAVQDVSKEVESGLGPDQGLASGEKSDNISAQLARMKPAAGVIDAFLEVERQVRRYLKASGLKQSNMGSAIVAFRRASEAPPRLKSAVTDLATLRNAAAHGGGDIDLPSALEYTQTAARVAREVEKIADDALTNVD